MVEESIDENIAQWMPYFDIPWQEIRLLKTIQASFEKCKKEIPKVTGYAIILNPDWNLEEAIRIAEKGINYSLQFIEKFFIEYRDMDRILARYWILRLLKTYCEEIRLGLVKLIETEGADR